MRYGLEGYGLYWYCLEMIAGSIEAHNITFELEHDSEVIAHNTGLHMDKVQQIMKYMVDVGLFENNNGVVTCLKMAKRLDSSMTSNPNFRKLIRNSHDGVMIESGLSHDTVMQEEKRREENRRDFKGKKVFTPPTVEEVSDYVETRQTKIDPIMFVNFYQSKNWMVGKNKMKDWRCAVVTWEQKQKESTPVMSDGQLAMRMGI